ncbi:MAG: bifunctional nuclease family protein [Candidatus Glassbacteria bacterium]|nr:bifunctional nuclease family protein [Candidatus Glassbacteria bacterium]
MIELTISGLGIDGSNNSPVVLLKEKEGERVIPIWIGPSEASAIAMEIAGVKFKRPLTHDLFKQCLIELGVSLQRVFINELKDNTYFARVFLESGGKVIELDARPSDSIALALRMKAPILTTDELLESASKIMPKTVTQAEDYDPEALRESLRKMNPEDFGKFSF